MIPVFNEERNIFELIREVSKVPIEKEIVLVDDGSTDATAAIIENDILPAFKGIQFFRHTKNLGKGAAIRTGLGRISGDIVVIQDGDLEYNPMEIPSLYEKFADPGVSVVYGTRFHRTSRILFVWYWFLNRVRGGHYYGVRYIHHFIGIQALNFLANTLYSAKISDEATCYKSFRKSVLDKISLRCNGFDFCPEFTAKVRKAGFAISEVPISYRPRSREEGKKLNWKHGIEAVYTLIKYRFVD